MCDNAIPEHDFDEVVQMIAGGKQRAYAAVNRTVLVA